jgi:hypothetical protein
MTDTATAAAVTVTAARFSESVHVLTDKPMRAAILGLAELEAKTRGGRPKEGDQIRTLLERELMRIATDDPERYAKALKLGTTAMRKRDREQAARRAARTQPATA